MAQRSFGMESYKSKRGRETSFFSCVPLYTFRFLELVEGRERAGG